MLQVDKELNAVIVRSEKELAIPSEIGGYKLTPADKYLLANGYALENKLMQSPKGEYIIADVSMTPDKKGYQFSNIQSISETKAKELLQKKLESGKESVLSADREHSEVKEHIKPEGRDMDAELKEAVANKDYEKMALLKEEGYKPSEEVIKGLEKENLVDQQQAIVIEKLFGTKPEVQEIKDTEDKKEYDKNENVELNVGSGDKKYSASELDKEFVNAVENNDFIKLSQLKEQGYKPSDGLMQSLAGQAPENTLIAVQTIFGLKSAVNSLGDIKLAHSQQSPNKDLTRPISNTIDRMFSDL